MKLYQDLVATQHPAHTWTDTNIAAVLQTIHPHIQLKVHGFDYLLTDVPEKGMFPDLPWRTGESRFGYYNTSSHCKFETPSGWFFTPQGSLHQHLLERPDE